MTEIPPPEGHVDRLGQLFEGARGGDEEHPPGWRVELLATTTQEVDPNEEPATGCGHGLIVPKRGSGAVAGLSEVADQSGQPLRLRHRRLPVGALDRHHRQGVGVVELEGDPRCAPAELDVDDL